MVHVVVLFLFIELFHWSLAGTAVAYDISAWAIAQVGSSLHTKLSLIPRNDRFSLSSLLQHEHQWMGRHDIHNIFQWSFCLDLFRVQVSNELSAGHLRAAKYSVIITVTQSLMIGLFPSIICTIPTGNTHALIPPHNNIQGSNVKTNL